MRTLLLFFLFAIIFLSCESPSLPIDVKVDEKGGVQISPAGAPGFKATLATPPTNCPPVGVAVFPDKMSVFYIGVKNPLTVRFPGVHPDSVTAKISGNANGATIKRTGGGRYEVIAKVIGSFNVDIWHQEAKAGSFSFRVKRSPDPVAQFGGPDGSVKVSVFKSRKEVNAEIKDFDFPIRCAVIGYELTRIPSAGEQQREINNGKDLNPKSATIVSFALPGDTYLFANVRARCPGDAGSRRINSLVYQIK